MEPIEFVNLEIYLHDTQTPSDTRILLENFIGMIMVCVVYNIIMGYDDDEIESKTVINEQPIE